MGKLRKKDNDLNKEELGEKSQFIFIKLFADVS
jgi:hypothetical protein